MLASGATQAGWRAGVECMAAEDEIVDLLCGPGMSVSLQQAAAAVELARSCALLWRGIGCHTEAVYRRRVHDFAWLDEGVWVVAPLDPDTMKQLEEITNAIRTTRRQWPCSTRRGGSSGSTK